MPGLGAMFRPTRPIAELPSVARTLEGLGYDELWVVEDCFAYGGLTAAATALAHTRSLTVGVGLLPAAVRNPAIAAMEISTLAALHPGRVRVAVGHGVESWMRQIGARPPDRMAALQEVTESLLALLRGETVTTSGRFVQLEGVKLERPPAVVPPVLIGTTGIRGTKLAGEIADGVMLPEGAGPPAVAATAQMLGHRGELTVYAWLRIDDDHDAACDVLLPEVTRWRDWALYPRLLEHAGLPADGLLEPAHLAGLTLAGRPEDCATAIVALGHAGATSVVVVPVGEDQESQLARFSNDVIPLVLANSLLPGRHSR